MKLRNALLAAGAVALALGLLTCGDDPVQPATPGWLNLRLSTPNADDGGILFTVGGAQVDSVRSTFPNIFLRRESGSTVRVVIVGSLGAGVIGQILVPDTRSASAYTAAVLEVAARGTFVQRSPDGYGLTVEPAR